MSFRDISKIIKAYDKKIRLQQTKNKEENNQSSQKILSKRIQAYDLFGNGVSPVVAAVKINLDFQS